MTITLRNARDGSTVEADPNDTDRLDRLAKLGYRPVGKQQPAAPPVKKAPARKRTPKK